MDSIYKRITTPGTSEDSIAQEIKVLSLEELESLQSRCLEALKKEKATLKYKTMPDQEWEQRSRKYRQLEAAYRAIGCQLPYPPSQIAVAVFT